MNNELAEHERQISRLLVRYAAAIDYRDWSLLAECFTPDCVFTARDLVLDGVDAIVRFMENAHRDIDGSHHRLSNIEIDVDEGGRDASSITYLDALIVHRKRIGGPTFRVQSAYHDRHRFDGLTWKIATRKVTSLWAEGNPSVLGPTEL